MENVTRIGTLNDRKITVSVAGNRFAMSWAPSSISWVAFARKLGEPIRTDESFAEYKAWPKSKRDEVKDIGGFVGGPLKDNRRKGNHIIYRDLITLDLDNLNTGDDDIVLDKLQRLRINFVIYSTRSHSKFKPRLRVIIPSNVSMQPDEYEPIARKVADYLGMNYADRTTFQAERLMYYPSCSKDSQFYYYYNEGPFLDKQAWLDLYSNWKDVTEWPVAPGETAVDRSMEASKQGNPLEKPGIVGAFNNCYTVPEAIDEFLSQFYTFANGDRYTYLKGSTTGGAVLYEDGLFLYSHHSTDPCCNKLVNAFDLVRIHLFGEHDTDKPLDTPINKLPSYEAMCNWAKGLSTVSSYIARLKVDEAKNDFAEINMGIISEHTESEELNEDDWRKKLDLDSKLQIISNSKNLLLILRNDPNLKDRFAYEEFSNRILINGTLPWDNTESVTVWSDKDDSALRAYLDVTYGITGTQKIYDAFSVVVQSNKYDEVKEYLQELFWDGIPRLETLFIDYLGCEDTPYTRAVTKKSLVAAVARVYNPGVKYDYMPILAGPQGVGKSTLLDKLAGKWFNDSLTNFEGKDASELLQGSWIVEVGELTGLSKSESNTVKQFLSKKEDIFRAAYGRRSERFKRRCVFFGTSNDVEFLKDDTGERRFWPIDTMINKPYKSVFTDLESEVDMIWAEAVHEYRKGCPLFLTKQEESLAREQQRSHKVINVKTGVVEQFLLEPITLDWDRLSIADRRMARDQIRDGRIAEDKLTTRDKVCAMEVWCECFGRDLGAIKPIDTREINSILKSIPALSPVSGVKNCGPYGRQRSYLLME